MSAKRILAGVAVLLLIGAPVWADAGDGKTAQVSIPAGPYRRGLRGGLSERVVITLKAYKMDKTEVTNVQYAACVQAGKCAATKYQKDDDPLAPVRGVTWFDADNYCKFAGRRLPTEAEWENAAFPSSTTESQAGRGPIFTAEKNLCKRLLIGGWDDRKCPRNLLRKKPDLNSIDSKRFDENTDPPDRADWSNGFESIYDLFGNVAEWVADWEDRADGKDFYLDRRPKADPQGPPKGYLKVIRGGSYLSSAGIDEGDRRIEEPTKSFPDVGFRCASDAAPAPK